MIQGVVPAPTNEIYERVPFSQENEVKKYSDVLEAARKKESLPEKIDTISDKKIQPLEKEKEVISKKYEERMRANQKFIKELKNVLRREVNLGNALREEEMLKARLEQIEREIAAIEKNEKENESGVREKAMEENESMAKVEKSETLLDELEISKIAPESIPRDTRADDYESDKFSEKNDFEVNETTEEEKPLTPDQKEKAESSESPVEAIIQKQKMRETVPDKLPVQPEIENLAEKKIVPAENESTNEKNPEERVAGGQDYAAAIASGRIKKMFKTKKKWETMQNMTLEKIKARPMGRKHLITRLESFRQEYENILGNEANPQETESVKSWIVRVAALSLEKEKERLDKAV